MGTPILETRPIGPGDLADLGTLFESERNTRHCWCMAFCASRSRFGIGWLTGGNRRRFEDKVAQAREPMGILASRAGQPVGWCACGPRSRYVAQSGPGHLLRDRDAEEDDAVWLLPCVFVQAQFRGQGVSQSLMRSAVELARQQGAIAIEGWPTTGSDPRSADAFVGRESVFADLGFRRVASAKADRIIMRLQLDEAPPSQPLSL